MLKYVQGDLFATGADALINTVNCEGYMSKGIAYQFKQRYPQNDKIYKEACAAGKMYIGTVLCHHEGGVTIINFPTKDRWRRPSQMAYVEKGLEALIQELPKLQVKSIAIPPLGCGNGGLLWAEVKAMIERKLAPLTEFDFIICQPGQPIKGADAGESKSPTIKSLLLLKIEEQLHSFSMTRLMCACVFVNYYCNRMVFTFGEWKDGPISDVVLDEAQKLKAYKKIHGLTSRQAYDAIYIRLCSKRTDDIVKHTEDAIKYAAMFVNSIREESALLAAAAILSILSGEEKTYLPGKGDDVSKLIGTWDEMSETTAVQKLVEANIAETDLCGELHLIKQNA